MTTTIPEATARERLQIIQNARTVALVGVSANPIRSSNFVASYLVRTPPISTTMQRSSPG